MQCQKTDVGVISETFPHEVSAALVVRSSFAHLELEAVRTMFAAKRLWIVTNCQFPV